MAHFFGVIFEGTGALVWGLLGAYLLNHAIRAIGRAASVVRCQRTFLRRNALPMAGWRFVPVFFSLLPDFWGKPADAITLTGDGWYWGGWGNWQAHRMSTPPTASTP